MFQSLRLKTDVVILENDDSWGGHNLQMARLVPSSKLACADKLTQTEHVVMEGSVFDCSNLNAERMTTITVPLASNKLQPVARTASDSQTKINSQLFHANLERIYRQKQSSTLNL